MQLNSDLIELLAVFEKNGVRYMIIGGYAVAFHAEPRYTKDCDIWIATDSKNAAAVFASLVEFKAPLKGVTAADFEDEDAFFFFGAPPNRVDLLMGPPGGDFDQFWPRRIETMVGEVKIVYASREDLIALKKAAGRAVDKRDIKALTKSSAPTKPKKK